MGFWIPWPLGKNLPRAGAKLNAGELGEAHRPGPHSIPEAI